MKYDVRVRRIASGGGYGNVGGSYPVVEFYGRALPRFIVGNESAVKYTRGKFLILPPHEFVDVNGARLVVGSDEPMITQRAINCLKENPQLASVLFEKKFAHLTTASRIDVSFKFPFFHRKNVCSYVGLPDDGSNEPSEKVVDAILTIYESLG